MTRPSTRPHRPTAVPVLPQVLGYAGLLPPAAVVAVLASGSSWWRFAALSIAYAYAALILSFLGGMWWGFAAQQAGPSAKWLWWAAVAPSLIALATFLPWAFGAAWPGPSLIVLGVSLLASLLVDRRLVADRLAPSWWMRLRVPLSLGLGSLTLVSGVVALGAG